MADLHLHIVCLDTPSPADYGGAIDMMNRIKSLHQLGIKIHLHYFSYGDRKQAQELDKYCEQIKAYERKTGWQSFSFSVPYIVQSRINKELITELKKDNFPVLLEGIHCTGILPSLGKKRKIVVRMHNDESVYYRQLVSDTSNLFDKIYYSFESSLLSKYNNQLPDHCSYACISESDLKRFREKYHLANCFFLPAFAGSPSVTGKEGVGNYCLYHGNLSVAENERAAIWLIENVFSRLTIPSIVAGKNPTKRLRKLVNRFTQCRLEANPSEERMNELITDAQINVLPCLNTKITGIRLKLLHAIFQGRHCLVNPKMVEGTGLETACHIGKNETAFASIISQLFHQPFTNEEIILRKKLLAANYDNKKNTEKLIERLFENN